jgi:DNA-binding MarR family transcriptional regulator
MAETGGAADARWLTDSELAAWLALAEMVIKLPAALDSQLQRDAGISHFEYMVLAGLSEAPGRSLRMSDLAMFANGSLSRLSHVVKRLEQRGWVRREACPSDGRYTNALLTDEGYAKVVATAPGHVDRVRALVVDALTPEQLGQLRTIGEAVLRRVDPEGCDPEGCDPERSEPWPGRRARTGRTPGC